MLPHEISLVLRRLVAIGAPKESLLSKTHIQYVYENKTDCQPLLWMMICNNLGNPHDTNALPPSACLPRISFSWCCFVATLLLDHFKGRRHGKWLSSLRGLAGFQDWQQKQALLVLPMRSCWTTSPRTKETIRSIISQNAVKWISMVNVGLRFLIAYCFCFSADIAKLYCSCRTILIPTSLASMLRLAVLLLLQAAFQKVVVILAPPCSTWVAINAGTSKRTLLCPAGDERLLRNRKSNKLATRTVA